MRRLLALLLAALLVAGCTKEEPEAPTPEFEEDGQAPPAPTPTPSPSPRPTTTTPSTTPARPTPSAPTPATPEGPPPITTGTKLLNWSFTLSVGGASLPIPGAPVGSQNCVAIPSTEMLRGQANATWGGATPLAQTSLDLLAQGIDLNSSVSGPSPITLSWTAVPAGNETLVIMHPTDRSTPVTPRITVAMDIVIEVPETEHPSEPAVRSCPR